MSAQDRADTNEATWRRLAERAIGGDLQSLESQSADGVPIAPLYQRRADDPPQPWRPGTAWSVAQRVDHPDAETANRLALLDLEGGADALVLVGKDSPYNRGFGAPLDAEALGLVLEGIELDFISLRLDVGSGSNSTLSALTDLVVARRLTSAALQVDIGFDPVGLRARLGVPIDDDPRPLFDLRSKAQLHGTIFLADGRPWHEAGAGEAQELAVVLATAVAYLRRQEALGLALGAAFENIAFLLAADAELFLGLAKFRALRRLWARVATASGLEPTPARLHAETSWRMMTHYDPWTNVMRATAATFAAGLGGADAISVLPFPLPLGLPDDGARRLARNLQRVLLDEANLDRVIDPAAGAGGFETLTEGLCAKSWALFHEIEREGGIARSIEDGHIQARVAKTAAARQIEIAHLNQGIVGTSRFASLDPSKPHVFNTKPNAAQATDHPDALPALRDAMPFEMLRARAEAQSADGQRPRVFLATLGAPAAFGPAATYAANFFATAGLLAEAGLEERDDEALVVGFAASGARVACICGPGAAPGIAALAKALRAAGARRVYRIGPGDAAMEGIDAFIQSSCDALQILDDALNAA